MKVKSNIEKIKQMMPDYVTGSLTENESEIVRAAIEESTELRELYVDMKKAFELTDSIRFDEPTSQYWNNLLPRIHERIDQRLHEKVLRNPLSYLWKALVPVAAALLIFIVYQIAYSPEPEISGMAEKKLQKESISLNDTAGTKVFQNEEDSDIVVVKLKKIRRNAVKRKSVDVEPTEPGKNDKIAEEDLEPDVASEYRDPALLAIEELSIFGAGSAGMLDEEIDGELERLPVLDREAFLQELENNL